ncbi:MAG TPA: class I SAM-dependent methyltransferase [Bryobacteraceae bacterium]|jgi:caffeoyl-CoA O-methyltransferase|nr:class I SAM-dependent methyltransferase [Bryobacteraceae bacterium]
MSRYEGLVDPTVIDYILKNSIREPDILARLRKETASHPKSNFQIPPEQGQLMRVLLRMAGARRVIEIGVFTGYSSLAMAMALPPDGHIVACDISDEYTQVARRYWAEGGVTGKIDLRIGPAKETLDGLIASGTDPFDFAFIDADKTGYPGYYEQCLKLLRTGGVIALDNMLSRGRVMKAPEDADAAALQKMNELIHHDERVDAILLPFGDGLTLAAKR